jgi:hypothetical protein
LRVEGHESGDVAADPSFLIDEDEDEEKEEEEERLYAITALITSPCTSVSRKSRPA